MDFDMKMLAYCGLYCEQCSARVGFLEQDARHLEGIPAQYRKSRTRLSDFDCAGCKGRNLCGPCKIKDCAVVRNVDSCAECDDFPCAVLDAFSNDGFPHHRRAMDNLLTIREKGIEAWFAEVKPALRCHCGKRLSWYYACPEHG